MLNRKSIPLRRSLAVLLASGLASQPAQALFLWDEITFFIASSTYKPGETVDAKVTFAAKPGIDLGKFSFALTWDTALAAPVATGSGSVLEWETALATRGVFSLLKADPQAISGSWHANSPSPSADVIPVSYANPFTVTFTFQTAATLDSSFVVGFELYNLADGTGEIIDTGSGFINWVTISPVPEPAGWVLLLGGAFGLAGWSRRPASIAGRAGQPAA